MQAMDEEFQGSFSRPEILNGCISRAASSPLIIPARRSARVLSWPRLRVCCTL
jgi:hypothetical protein